jgi:ATP-dependent Clp protease ATP-binding subunit ClpE
MPQQNNIKDDPRMQMGGGNGNGGQMVAKILLDQYGTDLTDLAKKGKIDPVIGRDKEIAPLLKF